MTIRIPTSLEAESRILGGAMVSVDWVNLMFSQLGAQHFYDPRNIAIFVCMQQLYEGDQSFDFARIEALLPKDKVKTEYLVDVYSLGNTALSISDLISEIKDSFFKRQLQMLGTALASSSGDSKASGDDILRQFEEKLFSLTQEKTRQSIMTFSEGSKIPIPYNETIQDRQDKFRRGENSFEGVPTHFLDLDKHLKGLVPGHFTIIGARPGVGKTTFALNLIENLCMKSKCKCLFFSLEMPTREVIEKLISQTAEVPYSKAASGNLSVEEFHQLNKAYRWLEKENRLVLDDQPALGIDQIKARSIRCKKAYNIDVIFIDYIQLVSSKKGQEARHLEIADISRSCKQLAKELKVPIVALAQLNRDVEKRDKKQPFISDLRESGSLEADADEILLLHRPEMYSQYEKPGMMEIFIAKNRFGPTGKFDMVFNKELGTLRDYAGFNRER